MSSPASHRLEEESKARLDQSQRRRRFRTVVSFWVRRRGVNRWVLNLEPLIAGFAGWLNCVILSCVRARASLCMRARAHARAVCVHGNVRDASKS